MMRRLFFCLLIVLIVLPFALPARENRYIYSETQTGSPLFVLTAPDHPDPAARNLLEAYVQTWNENPPEGRVLAAFTVNDFSRLPESLRKDPPEGTAALIEHLVTEDSLVMIVLLPGAEDRVTVHTGIRGETPPRWLVQTVSDTLQDHDLPWQFAESRMQVYRMGWIREEPVVRAYHNAGIPVLCLETSLDLAGVLDSLARSFSPGIPEEQDRHFLIQRFHNLPFFIGERSMVVFIVIAFALILLFLFVFSFLTGISPERRLRYTLSLWWLPLLYLVVNITGLYAGGAMAAFLFKFRFSTSESWTLLPVLAIAAKFIFAWFITTAILSFNQAIRFPDDDSVYGYLSAFCAMVNIFIFSAFDFSLTPMFVLLYAITFIFYHLKHPVFMIAGIFILFLPLYPYGSILFSGTREAIEPLFSGDSGWNIRIAFLALPFQFMISRFLHSMGFFGRKNDFYLPVQLFPAVIAALVLAVTILFYPGWGPGRPIPVQIRHTLSDSGNRIELTAPADTRQFRLARDPALAVSPDFPEEPDSFFRTETHTRRFLDKQLADITITPALPANRIEVVISADRGISVYSASIPHTYLGAGEDTLFVSPENPSGSYSFHFSSGEHSRITAKIRMYSTANPWGITLEDPYTEPQYVLEAVKTVDFIPSAEPEQPQDGDS